MTLLKDKSLERLTNVAVIVVAVVLVFSLLWRDFAKPSRPSTAFKASRVDLASITKSPSRLNIVLGISTTCHFCEQNVGFYQKLSTLEIPGKVAFYTVFPQPQQEVGPFLQQKEIHPTTAVSKTLSAYDITGTPTLLLVSPDGKVEHAWVGALDPKRQQEVLDTIRQTS